MGAYDQLDHFFPFKGPCEIILFTLGPPQPPSDVALSPFSPQAVNISWLLPNLDPNINTSFTLTVMATQQPSTTQIQHTLDTFYIFSPIGSPCEEHQINVTARNEAGVSEPGEALFSSLPLPPSVGTVESSLQYSVRKSEGKVTVAITHQVKLFF